MIRVGIVGGTGYTGVELLRLLAAHPEVSLQVITSRRERGRPVAELFPNLRGIYSLEFSEPGEEVLAACDLVFFATPGGTAMEMAPALLDKGVRIVDLSADFRLRDSSAWERWYGAVHACPELARDAVYGLCEVSREQVREARLVANPGCYPTAVQLGFLPLLERGVIEPHGLVADAKSGVSGAGRKEQMSTQLGEAAENMKAYSAGGHRHLPEILQGLEAAAGRPLELTFVPHLAPMIRGIHATLYGRIRKPGIDIQEIFESRYRHEPFVDVLPAASHPETRSVRGGNGCRVSWHRPQNGDIVVVLSVIDNLGKGAAGQAIQNMNIMFGLDETTGLGQVPLMP